MIPMNGDPITAQPPQEAVSSIEVNLPDLVSAIEPHQRVATAAKSPTMVAGLAGVMIDGKTAKNDQVVIGLRAVTTGAEIHSTLEVNRGSNVSQDASHEIRIEATAVTIPEDREVRAGMTDVHQVTNVEVVSAVGVILGEAPVATALVGVNETIAEVRQSEVA